MFETVEFLSEDATLRGRFYRPARTAPWPAVVMTHGTTATITMCLDRYARCSVMQAWPCCSTITAISDLAAASRAS
jgi:hypothetical protein